MSKCKKSYSGEHAYVPAGIMHIKCVHCGKRVKGMR